jgi:TolB-like protein
VIVLILSQDAAASPHVLREIERATSKRHPVVTLRLDQVPLSAEFEYFLNTSQWLDASGGDATRMIPKLIAAVRSVIKASAVTAATTLTPHVSARSASTRSPNRIAIAMACVVGLTIAGIAADRLWLAGRRAASVTAPTAPASVPLSAPAAPMISDKSVAVLPFLDMSEKKDQEYFSDGMTEEIIDLLVKIPELIVPARTSCFYFKGKPTQIPEIAKELGVAHVLEGSVRKSGNHLRVTVQLVRADNGYHLWSETYDRQLNDVFKLQDEIAAAVVKALKVSLLDGEAPNAILTTNAEAYELYLQARALLNKGTSDDTLKGYADLQQAVSLDPKFALAWATLAGLLSSDTLDWTLFGHDDSTAQSKSNDEEWGPIWARARTAAHAAAERAIKFGPNLGGTHAAMALVLEKIDWDWTAADGELKRARELEPGNARITLAAAGLAVDLGRVSEGLQLAKAAARQDPLGWATSEIQMAQYVSGALNDAQASARRLIELYPTAGLVHFNYAFVLLAQGEPQTALSEFEQERAVQFREVGLPLALDAVGRHSDADRAIAVAEKNWARGMAYPIAYIYASRSDPDRAFYWLERAYRQHDNGLTWLKVDPMLRSLRRDPRYKALLLKMRLPA